MVRNLRSVPPLLKWTGSKRSQARRIHAFIPPHNRYFEPFLGGGAVLYLAARPGAVAGDIYRPLVEFWRLVQANAELVVSNYQMQWQALQEDLPQYFYQVRERFNRYHDPLDLSFLMRTCVNGIARFNAAGEFNNSFHLSRRGMTPDRFARVVQAWNERIKGVRFVCQDYAATVAEAERDDFVYLDPPYVGNQARYVSDLDVARLYATLAELNQRGVQWALSFDGWRGKSTYAVPPPPTLYEKRVIHRSGRSAVGKVLNGALEQVYESLYLNYEPPDAHSATPGLA